MESLVEEAMQVVVEQELEVEELPATLQVAINIRAHNFVFLYFYDATCLKNRNAVGLSYPAGGAVGLASCEGGEGGEGHGHAVRPPGGCQDHSQFRRGGLILEMVRTILNSGGVAC